MKEKYTTPRFVIVNIDICNIMNMSGEITVVHAEAECDEHSTYSISKDFWLN